MPESNPRRSKLHNDERQPKFDTLNCATLTTAMACSVSISMGQLENSVISAVPEKQPSEVFRFYSLCFHSATQISAHGQSGCLGRGRGHSAGNVRILAG